MFLFACFSLFIWACFVCRVGMDPSLQPVSCHPAHRVTTSISCLQEAGIDKQLSLCSCICLLLLKLFFFFFRCLCAQSCVCDTAECAVSPVRWYVWIVIGWLVSLRGSSRSKGRCSGAAVGELEWSPPATALSLWASSSKRCLVAGRRLQAPGALMLGKDAWDTEKRVMCMSVFVCVLWGDPK